MAHVKLDLDALILEAPRLVAPTGAVATFQDYTTDDLLRLLALAQPVQGSNADHLQALVQIADGILELCTAAPINRRAIDAVPVSHILDVLTWLQTAEPPTLFMSSEPDGEIVLAGKTRAVRLLTVGAMRQFSWFAQAQAPSAVDAIPGDAPATPGMSLLDAVLHSAEMMAGMIEDLTPEAWRALPRTQTTAIERYIMALMQPKPEAEANAADPKAPAA